MVSSLLLLSDLFTELLPHCLYDVVVKSNIVDLETIQSIVVDLSSTEEDIVQEAVQVSHHVLVCLLSLCLMDASIVAKLSLNMLIFFT